MLGTGEVILILLAALILFGPSKLPELARTLGKGMREFKRAQNEVESEITHIGDGVTDETKYRDMK